MSRSRRTTPAAGPHPGRGALAAATVAAALVLAALCASAVEGSLQRRWGGTAGAPHPAEELAGAPTPVARRPVVRGAGASERLPPAVPSASASAPPPDAAAVTPSSSPSAAAASPSGSPSPSGSAAPPPPSGSGSPSGSPLPATPSGSASASASGTGTGTGTGTGSAPPPSPAAAAAPAAAPVVAPSEEALEETTACGEVLATKLVLHAPPPPPPTPPGEAGAAERCAPADVYAAVRGSGRREGQDAPLHVTLPPRCGGGAVRWLTAAQACDVLQRAGFLFMSGDSLARHLTNALFAVVTGDPAGAGAAFTSPEEDGYHSCDCRNYFDDGHWATEDGSMGHNRPRNRYCRERAPAFVAGYFGEAWVLPARYPRGVPLADVRARYPSFCPRWERWHFCYQCDAPGMPLPPAGVVFRQGGLHLGALDEAGVREVFAAMPPGVPEGWPRVCSLLHAPGNNKPVEYLHTHGMAPTEGFNALISASPSACKRPGDAMFDAFTPTRNASSIDGQHYPLEPNLVMAQLLLNTVALMTGQDLRGG